MDRETEMEKRRERKSSIKKKQRKIETGKGYNKDFKKRKTN